MIPLLLLAALAISPQGAPAPVAGPAPKALVVGGCVVMKGHVAASAPRAVSGLWLDETGQPSACVTALGMLVWAGEGSFLRSGRYRRDVRKGCRALLAQLASPEWEKRPRAERFHDEVLIALALFVQARMSTSHVLHCHVEGSLAEVFTRERLRSLFPAKGVSDPSKDGARILSLLLWRQVQLSRASHPLAAGPDFVAPGVPAMDAAPMRQWIARCTKEKSLGAERLLLLFLGQLLLNPPVEHPLQAGITGLLWKRAHSAMALEQTKSGKPPAARLLFVDTLLRNEFLTHAFLNPLRKDRQDWLDARRSELEKALPSRKGLAEGDLYHMITLPFVCNYARWCGPMPREAN